MVFLALTAVSRARASSCVLAASLISGLLAAGTATDTEEPLPTCMVQAALDGLVRAGARMAMAATVLLAWVAKASPTRIMPPPLLLLLLALTRGVRYLAENM
jgi:hypothetical protein